MQKFIAVISGNLCISGTSKLANYSTFLASLISVRARESC